MRRRTEILISLLLVLVASCAWAKAAFRQGRDTGGKAAITAVVIVLAFPLGPLPAALFGGGTVVVTDLFFESVAQSAGEKQGEGALKKEIERWKGRAVQAEQAASIAERSKSWLKDFITKVAIWCFILWFGHHHWRNRHNFKYGYWRGVWWHGLFGGKIGVDKSNGRG